MTQMLRNRKAHRRVSVPWETSVDDDSCSHFSHCHDPTCPSRTLSNIQPASRTPLKVFAGPSFALRTLKHRSVPDLDTPVSGSGPASDGPQSGPAPLMLLNSNPRGYFSSTVHRAGFSMLACEVSCKLNKYILVREVILRGRNTIKMTRK